MKRIAFIIGSPSSRHGYLQGVQSDHTNYRAFLTSNPGGAWEHHEIQHLGSPSRRELRAALDGGSSADFAFVAFAGHGFCHAANGETYICLNDVEDMPVWELNTGSSRQITVVDACRTFIEEQIQKSDGRIVMGSDRLSDPYRGSCRRYYDAAVQQAEEGVETLFSASPNQAASESAEGGFFTTSMIRGSVTWARAKGNGREAQAFLPVNSALDMAKGEMASRRLPQRPEGDYGRRRFHFPFAVA